jgi:4-alpha-glucanotransferase
LPVSSLPSDFGIGELGPQAVAFAGFVKECGLSFWQVLPLGPSSPALGNSPYSGFSAFAGSELLVSPEPLVEDGFLTKKDIGPFASPPSGAVDYGRVIKAKGALLDLAFSRAEGGLLYDHGFVSFLNDNASWLNDYALFMAAHDLFEGRPWSQWPEDIKRRYDYALAYYGEKLAKNILRLKFGQWLFFRQLGALKGRLRDMGLGLIGDLAFYVNHDSADVWANPGLFRLDQDGETAFQAGVQPDYYSKTGQLWGNPVYDWPRHRDQGYAWWRSRILHSLGQYDWLRLDHFRAFAAYWEVPQGEKDATKGCFKPGPGLELFGALGGGAPRNIISEDLGFITPDVTELRQALGYPGMRVLHFGVGDPTGLSLHCPFRIEADNAVYTSTHDTNTAKGWYLSELKEEERKAFSALAGHPVDPLNASKTLIRLAWCSTAALAVTTVQDLLGLGSEARINVPGTPSGNWTWKLKDLRSLTPQLAKGIAALSKVAGRDNCQHPNILHY